ncbi:F-type H+-transporting ATPase subunit delta [Amycolatopsis bartoniae]|uniref:ATP synthase subunit delta n=1 Tax=Amycolatopsis bartoniae TaxID=941986 RepID=A0A8H9IXP3_9PSEU|nr:F0F1 ATP synthase subunit delta [Amycolatopsis bartoniae]MBB2936228.1 F-type H+-transporting ATPase subunit delta [Amycolatopsis bartoniae]TVT11606.1 F0F1 ATP synthase subunit delta [Amycolatopsis bartoniae]GHF80633.1 ATP synthase subunit delta [Amycolatopsis bartoniae]
MTSPATLHAASREALAAAERTLDGVLGQAGVEPETLGSELFSVVELLTREIGLRRALGDGSSDPEARKRLVTSLLDGKVSGPALRVLEDAVGQRWSSPRELLDGLESLGRSALLTSAEKAGNLDAVEDELFRIARILVGEPELDQALSDQAAPVAAKRQLVRELFGGKAGAVTLALVEQVVTRQTGRGVGFGLDRLVRLAAERRERSVAYVTSAAPLTGQQEQQLTEKLTGIYGRQITLLVEVDPKLGGGLVVRVGDEVIDGSAAGRIAALRRQLA